ncbi:MAG: hypothetical protein ACK5RG_17490 [Cyclobacteriaceae bacterium]|jgi:hypothetical protein|nr:hypothetical protein [Flammeovirgaceae bacterium]
MLKRFQMVVATILCLVATPTVAQKERDSYQPVEPIVVDGLTDEWKTDWWLDQDGKFLFNIANDAENIYWRIKISDDLTQQKIALYGLFVKFDGKGKKRSKLGIKYPVGKDPVELKKAPEPLPQDLAGRTQAKKLLLTDVEVLELLGLSKEPIVSSRLGLMNGIEVMMVITDDGSYVYEAKIPLKAYKLKKEDVELLGFTVETGKLDLSKNGPANPNAQTARSFGQTNYGMYHPLSSPAYMWVAIKLH